jgi:uncharacterized protein
LSFSSLFIAWQENLPPRRNGVRKHRNIPIPMPDGVVLMTDHYAPRGKGPFPTILMRLPYGRKGFAAIAEIYAERGFHMLLQACRGTEKSGGEFDPLINERADGLATLDWIKEQPWYDGRLGLTGPSYLGYAQWAICDALPPVAAMATKVTTSNFRSVVFPSGAFHAGLWLSWLQVIDGLKNHPLKTATRLFSGAVERNTEKAALSLPLIDADQVAVKRRVPFWHRWFKDSIGNDAFWAEIDHSTRLSPTTPPVHFISGWYDFMIDQLLADYQRLVELGHTPYLTVGTWFHVSEDLQRDNIKETLTWMRAKLLGETEGLRDKPVRIHIGGLEQWREFDSFPPGPPAMERFFLGADRALLPALPAQPTMDHYRYDPADPTPNVGGAIFAFTGAGAIDNAPRESRADVLSYTSAPLPEPITIIGQTHVTLRARSSTPFVDFFLVLCEVGTDGISRNITDGLIRVDATMPRDTEGWWTLPMTLHATAHCFRAGTRLRLQISSGAHPRYARNTGTDEPVGTATELVVADIEISGEGTEIVLPVYAIT